MHATLQTAYQIALVALTVLILLTGESRMKRAAIIFLVVMLAAAMFSPLWPSVPYALGMIGVDAVAILAITWHPAGKWQSIVGGSYIIQIGIHIGRIFSDERTDINSYWWGLSLVAILQLLLIGGWWLNDRSDRRRFRGCADTASSRSRHQGMAK